MSELKIKECKYCKRKDVIVRIIKAYSETRMRVICICGHEIMLDKNKKGVWE